LGFFRQVNLAIAGGSISNGTPSSPSYLSISLEAGVWMVQYYHTITCTDVLTLTQITHGITGSAVGTYYNKNSQSSYATETIPISGAKYITNTLIIRSTTTQNFYSPITISYTTTGTITINYGIYAVRIA
jgi:hypothetical protein